LLLLENKEMTNEQIPAFLSVILLDMWGYKVMSKNLQHVTAAPSDVISEIGKWTGVDIIVGYHHPDLGFFVINPKNPPPSRFKPPLKIQGFTKTLIWHERTHKDSAYRWVRELIEKACLVDGK